MSTAHGRRWVSFAAAAVTAAVFSSLPGWGQVGPGVRNGDPASDAAPDKDSPIGVTIPQSPGATELLAKAKAKAAEGEWKTAAEFYNEAAKQYAGRVTTATDGRKNGIFPFIGVGPVVQERLAKWDAAGLKVYDTNYDKTAADLLASAGPDDIGTVQAVFWEYFVTPAGKQAGIRLVDNYLEAGDYAAAAWVATRLKDLHPALGGDRGAVCYRAITALHYAGDDGLAKAIAGDLKETLADATITIAGKDVRLTDAADAVIAAPVPVTTGDASGSDSWPSYGGIGGRGRLSPTTAHPGASLTSVSLQQPEFTGQPNQPKAFFVNQDASNLKGYQALGVMPVVDGGALFFQDGRNIYAIDIDSGLPLPGWLATYPGNRNGRYQVAGSITGRAHNETLTLTVSSSRVFAVTGQPDRNANNPYILGSDGNLLASSTKLVCLDRTTGREQWTRTPADLPEAAGTIRSGTYNGTPLLVPARFAGKSTDESQQGPEDSILVAVRGGKDNQFDDCYIVCLSARTGEYRWSTYVGSATRTFTGYEMGVTDSQDPTQLALADGRVVVMSNLGTVSSLDPADGRIIWLAGYNRDGQAGQAIAMRRGVMRVNNDISETPVSRPWTRNPVVVSDGKIFALPTDTASLFVFDAETGAEIKRISTKGFEYSLNGGSDVQQRGKKIPEPNVAADVLLGVRGDVAYLSTFKSLLAIDWKDYNAAHPLDSIKACSMNLAGFVGGQTGDPNGLFGRGFLTANSLFVTSNTHLYQLDPDKLDVVAMYPEQGQFFNDPDKPGAGNVVVTSQSVIVAGQKRVDVYMDLSLVRANYQAQIRANPSDPRPHIRYAEALFAAGESADALAEVDAAIDLVGGRDGMRPGPARENIYTAVLDFARRAADGTKKTRDAESTGTAISRGTRRTTSADMAAFTDQLFDRLVDSAYTPVQRATARLERARFEHDRRGYAAEIELCQQVLSNPDERDAMWQEDQSGGQTAEKDINDAIKLDKDAYAPIEAKAAAAREQAGTDPDKLLAMANLYPNSDAATAARQSAVDTFEANKNIPRAIEILRQMFAKANNNHDVQCEVLTRITGDYLNMPNGVGPAVDRLAWAKRLSNSGRLPHDLQLPDGTTIKEATLYTEALVKLRALQTDAALATLPDFHIPANKDGSIKDPFVPGEAPVIGSVSTLVHPLTGYSCFDQILTWSPAGLRIYPVGQTTPIATVAVVDDAPIAAARIHAAGGDKWVVWTGSSVTQVSAVDGSVDWNFKLTSAPAIPVSTGTVWPDEPPSNSDDANSILQRQNMQLQQMQNAAILNGNLRARRGRVINVGGQPGGPVPAVLPIASTVEQITTAHMAGDRLVAVTSAGRVLAVQLADGKLVWQSRPSERAPNQMGANLGFAFARFDDPAGSTVVIYDSTNGRVMQRRKFGPENSGIQLVNVALSEEGSLAITLQMKVKVLNLYDDLRLPGLDLKSETSGQENEIYSGLTQADQLVIAGGRVIALYNAGTFFRSYDVAKRGEASNPLSTGGGNDVAWLRVLGSQAYVLQASNWKRYNLADGREIKDVDVPWQCDDPSPEHARGLFIGRHCAVVLDDPVDNRGPVGSPNVNLLIYDRGRLSYAAKHVGSESGIGITEWLPVEGGFYYLTTDQKLHHLAVAQFATATTAPAN